MTDTSQEAVRPGSVSRRRVLHGAAWATPAILIATASPSAAASTLPPAEAAPTIMGALALAAPTSAYNEGELYVTSTLVYSGDTYAAPVTDVTCEVEIPSSRIGNPAGAVVEGSGWSFQGFRNVGAMTIITAAWQGAPLEASAGTTTPLSVRLSKNGDLSSLSVAVVGRGNSVNQAVPPARATVSSSFVANGPVFHHGGAVRFEEWFKSKPQKVSAWVIDAAQRWTGPWYPVAPAISDVEVEFRIPAAEANGSVAPIRNGVGADWAPVSTPTVVDGMWRYHYAYNGVINESRDRTTELQFAIPTLTDTPTYVDYVIRSKSSGQPLTRSGRVTR